MSNGLLPFRPQGSENTGWTSWQVNASHSGLGTGPLLAGMTHFLHFLFFKCLRVVCLRLSNKHEDRQAVNLSSCLMTETEKRKRESHVFGNGGLQIVACQKRWGNFRERVKRPTLPRRENMLSIIGQGMKGKDSKERKKNAFG